jgi:outer membrane protein assembly factor BamB
MHANPRSKLYCLDGQGKTVWTFTAQGHIESTPTVAAGRVYFGAGDDGVYCLDAKSGQELWHRSGEHHVDARLQVVDRRVFGGSGVSRLRTSTEVFCLDAASGAEIWSTLIDLPVWGSPCVEGGQVFVGLGNGRLTKSAEPPDKPAGAVACLRSDDGHVLWRFEAADGVMVRPAVEGNRVFFGARDGFCYAVARQSGKLLWRQSLGSPIVASVGVRDDKVYAIGSEGRVCRLNARDGKIEWTFDVAAATRTQPRLFSSPTLSESSGRTRLVFGAELRGWADSAAVVYCLQEDR